MPQSAASSVSAAASIMKRKVITTLAVPLAIKLGERELHKSKLKGPHTVYLPKARIDMHYYERSPPASSTPALVDDPVSPTILLLHGFSSSAQEFFGLVRQFPPHVRILIPEQLGHGEDCKRAVRDGRSDPPPTARQMLETTCEWLDLMLRREDHRGTRVVVNALGTSFGGVLLYYLKWKRPESIHKTVLVSPAIVACLAGGFLTGLIAEQHRFVDFQTRKDVVQLFRNFLWIPHKRRMLINDDDGSGVDDGTNITSTKKKKRIQRKRKMKKDPIPKFIYDILFELDQRNVPRGHNKGLQDNLIRTTGIRMMTKQRCEDSEQDHDTGTESAIDTKKDDDDDIFLVTTDLDSTSPRLVVWPEEDQICNYTKGMQFFQSSVETGNTRFVTIPNCGHVFNNEGKAIYDLILPTVRPFLLDFTATPPPPTTTTASTTTKNGDNHDVVIPVVADDAYNCILNKSRPVEGRDGGLIVHC